ncbi:MAG TPA: DUF4136 domain-containing protein, partial [Steroidobacteraceae bacterium]|nr:DUF4136 domain-containing protein [Steroidobacteraceae bacterium]
SLFSQALHAADHIVDFDRQFDFSTLKTFAIGGTSVTLDRPEISNPLIIERTTAAIRAALIARGLKEINSGADLTVDWTLSGQGFHVNPWGRALPIDEARAPGSPVGRGVGAVTESFIEGLLVIDLTQPSTGLLLWRGVLRDKQNNAARLAQKLDGYAKKLLAKYPRQKKKP